MSKHFKRVLFIDIMFRSPPPSVSKTLDNVSRENNCRTPSSNPSTKGELLSYGPHRNTSPKLIARQLNNTTHYIKIHPNPIPPLVRSITQFLNYMRDNLHIDHTTYKFLLPHSSPRAPLFYLLPKFHNPNIPGHPIISGCDCPSDDLSKYVDHYLKPLVPLIPSNIKDTTHFLNTIFQIPTQLPHNTILVTIDVTSFYTNIPNNKAAIHALSTHTPHPPLQDFRTFLSFILKQNFFLFNDQHYLQTQGTTMGTRMAPSYANIFMAALEKRMLHNSPQNLQPLTWLRFIDDIFMLWTHGPQNLTHFLQHLNSFHPTIKFTHQQSHTSVNFLDTTIRLTEQRTLQSPLYTKPTDKGLLLHQSSYHPNACKKGIINSQALRYRQIIINSHDLHQHLQRLYKLLLARGYVHFTITAAFNIATSHTQRQLLLPKPPSATNGTHLPFIIPFNTDLP